MKNKNKKKPPIVRLLTVPREQIVSRSAVITRRMLGRNFYVYNGNTYVNVAAVPLRLGTKFGEYCPTRKRPDHLKKKKKKLGKR